MIYFGIFQYKHPESASSDIMRTLKVLVRSVSGVDKNNRKFSKYVKSKTKSRTTIGPIMTKDKRLLTDEKEMAEELNQFFSSVFTQEDLSNIPEAEDERGKGRMRPVSVSEQNIKTKIKKLRKEAAPGPDGITPEILQKLSSSLTEPLEVLFNKSLETGDIPEEWKKANVTPIFKKGTKGDPGNYRPVSLTSVPCKILETIVKDRIVQHLIENKLIKNSQHGFMPGKSCATNLVTFMDNITQAVDDGCAVDIFYLDFAKAFDKVPRKRLIKKLEAKGIEKGVVKWIENWLTGRTQKVCIQGEKSEDSAVDSGVPQGTVLGPVLFSVYIDDLETETVKRELDVKIIKFADDTKGAKIIRGPDDRDNLQEALDCLCEWADKWGMKFNLSKCKVMHVGKHNQKYEYFMNGEKIGTTEEERDIGVAVTVNMKPSSQCSKAAGRATSVLNQFRREFHYRDRHIFVKLYKQYVRPHLEFAVPAWSPWLKGDIDTLEKVQEKAVKMVAGLKGKEYVERCEELGLPSLERRRHEQDMALVFKMLRENSHEGMFTLAERADGARTRQTTGEKNLVPKFARTDQRKYSFAVRTVEKWNGLPDDVKQAANQEIFKARLKKLKE